MSSLNTLLHKLERHRSSVSFHEVIDVINEHYHYTPARFSNGIGEDHIINEAGSNEGSCRIFAFAKLNELDIDSTLNCFGDYYRKDVLLHPEGHDHANIRLFMKYGWDGVSFEAMPLAMR